MNTWTNWYGAVGLISTLGKNSFAAGEVVSSGGQWVFQKARENLIELKADVALVGEIKVFESLENVSKWSTKKAKSCKVKCEEWETWAEQKFAEAKVQEELNEDWKDNVNPEVPTLKKIVSEKLFSAKEKAVKGIQKLEQKYFPQTKLETPEKVAYRSNCLRFVGIYY